MTFGTYLRNQRETNGWSIKDIADRLKFSSSYVSQIENGVRMPSQKQLSTLAGAYQLPEEDIKKHWAEGKIHQVSVETDYKFNIRDVGEKKIHEVTSELEKGIEELKNRFSSDDHFKLPVLVAIPIDDLDHHLRHTDNFLLLPKENVPVGHRMFGCRVSDLDLPEAGIIKDDFIILDADEPVKNGDIVVIRTPDGLLMTHYYERSGHLELRPEKKGFKKTYPLSESKMIGRLRYHIKKY